MRVGNWAFPTAVCALFGLAPARATPPDLPLATQPQAPVPTPVTSEPPLPLAYGPPSPAPPDFPSYDSFGRRVGAVKWELGGLAAALTLTNLPVVIRDPQPFRFRGEGWFGKDTPNAGVDKLAHAWNTYVISDILYRRMARKTGGGPKSARTAAVLGLGLQTYGELFDSFHKGSGFSMEDMAFNLAGAGFGVMRHSVPGMADKVDFRLMIVPNKDVITFRGKEHFEQQWFLLAFKGSGFKATRGTALRYLEFHIGYHAERTKREERDRGIGPVRKPFIGVGLNLSELFLKGEKGSAAEVGRAALDYLQVPYTAVHVD